MKLIPADVSNFLDYNPETGDFIWLKNRKGGVKKGDIAGCVCTNGYRYIVFNMDHFLAHRLAWFFVYGEDAGSFLDHANGIPTDNRIANLRKASHTQNRGNQRIRKDSLTGYKGVTKVKNGWRARIKIYGKFKYLGVFPSPQVAHAAYCRAAVELFGEFARAA